MRIAPPRIGLTLATVLTATLIACVLAVGNTSGDLEGLNAGASDGFVRRYGR